MCLQDLRMARRTTRSTFGVLIGADGTGVLPGLGRAAMIAVVNDGNDPFLVVKSPGSAPLHCVADSTRTLGDVTAKIYTAQTLLCDAFGPLAVFGVAATTVTVIRWDYDSATMHEAFGEL